MLGTGLIKCNHSRPLKCMQCMTAFAGIPLTSFLADVKLMTACNGGTHPKDLPLSLPAPTPEAGLGC